MTTTLANGTGSSRSASSTAAARQLYQHATRAFLVRDYTTAATCLQDGLTHVETVQSDAWFIAVQSSPHAVPADVEVRRRLDILKVTLLATVRSSPASLSPAPQWTSLLELEPDQLVSALWSDLTGSKGTTTTSTRAGKPGDIVPTPAAAHLHPSLAVSLALAALKLEAPKAARAVAEAWFGSVSEEVEILAADFATSGQVDWQSGDEFPLDQVAGGSSSGVRTAPGLSDSSTFGTASPAGRGDSPVVRALVASWLKLLDLLVFHILPKLGEWDAAGDFVRLQSQENGGWVPDVRVEASLRYLKDLQQEEVHLAAVRIQRQKELEIARAEKKKQASAPSSRRGSDKGKQRADQNERGHSPATSGSPPRNGPRGSKSPSPNENKTRSPRVHGSPPPAGFASLRDSLSTYLQRPDASTSGNSAATTRDAAARPGRQRTSPVGALVSYLRYHYSTDPIRLVSFVCFVLALITWTRRRLVLRRSRGERGLGVGDALRLAASRVAQTVGMATKITAL